MTMLSNKYIDGYSRPLQILHYRGIFGYLYPHSARLFSGCRRNGARSRSKVGTSERHVLRSFMFWLLARRYLFQIPIFQESKPKIPKWCQTTGMNSNEGPLHLGYHIRNDMDLSQEYQFFPPTLVFDPAYA